MTSSELKRNYQINSPYGLFFHRANMKYFGDTMKNFGVIKHVDCYELYRKKAAKCGFIRSWFFNKETFKIY